MKCSEFKILNIPAPTFSNEYPVSASISILHVLGHILYTTTLLFLCFSDK